MRGDCGLHFDPAYALPVAVKDKGAGGVKPKPDSRADTKIRAA